MAYHTLGLLPVLLVFSSGWLSSHGWHASPDLHRSGLRGQLFLLIEPGRHVLEMHLVLEMKPILNERHSRWHLEYAPRRIGFAPPLNVLWLCPRNGRILGQLHKYEE